MRLRPTALPWLDVVLALAVAALGQLDVWGPRLAGAHIAGPRPAVAACYLATAFALAWRRRAPVAVAAVITCVDLVQWLALGSSAGNGTLLPGLLALFSLGAYAAVPAVVPAAAVVVFALAHEFRNPHLPTTTAAVRAAAWDLTLFGAWLLGAYIRTRRLYVAELRERAARAEDDRERRAAAAVRDERARIARELHDAIAHGVSVMVVQAEAAEEVLELDAAAAKRALQKVQESGREALDELRRLVGILRTDDEQPRLAPEPGLASVDELLARVHEAGFAVELKLEGRPRRLPAGIDLSAYRIVQEALTNVMKHAGPARAVVSVDYGEDALVLEVTDDGRHAATTNGSGHGLTGMRERVALYGGELEAGQQTDGGFRVRARLPLRGG